MAKQAPIILSHWYHSIEGLQESPQKFYKALVESILQRQVPDIEISRILYQEGGVFSAKREYLRVQRKEHFFDICAAPFGNEFFVSWWLGEKISFFWSLILMIPFLGIPMMNYFRPQTYYRHDTALMFQQSIS